jgi:hypothetical protein
MNTEMNSSVKHSELVVQKPYQTPKLEKHGVYTLTTGLSIPIGSVPNPFTDLSLIPEEIGL